MTNEEAIQGLKDILEEATSDKDAVCYVTSEDAEALNMAIEALSADALHIEVYRELYEKYVELKHASANAIHGEWIIEDAHTEHCSVCGYAFHISALFAVGGNDEPNFCPNCGARMKGGDDE